MHKCIRDHNYLTFCIYSLCDICEPEKLILWIPAKGKIKKERIKKVKQLIPNYDWEEFRGWGSMNRES